MTLPPDLIAALNEQHTHERENAAIYAQMGFRFDREAWQGFTDLMRQQAVEEDLHAKRIAQYMTDKDAPVMFWPVAIPDAPITVLERFTFSRMREAETTSRLTQLYFFAESQEHPQTCYFLQTMLEEQIEEEKKFMDILTQVNRAGDNNAALLLIDAQLALGG